ncbi:hypothetical protein BD626DRAFT_32776 [Schizophyllum amplum]|uniref:Protein kinase domain-containing protein n=1 Tax=Schizophyllum amplum TaxID=97359 RepID=A0A550CE51_9AGAR|nr:hypothetical protein BD626DRAFT_32776 [Auriculariopsis ampla]
MSCGAHAERLSTVVATAGAASSSPEHRSFSSQPTPSTAPRGRFHTPSADTSFDASEKFATIRENCIHHGDPQNRFDLRSEEILKQMRTEINECSWDDFMTHYMPFVPEEQTIDTAVDMLKTKSLLQNDGSAWLWKENEKCETYRLLAKASDTLRRLSIPNRTVTCQLVEFSNQHSRLRDPGSSLKTDAIFALISPSTSEVPEELTFSNDTAVTTEYTPHIMDALENRKQLVSGAVYAMNVDARRNYMFSLSIAGTLMTVWYFSRSHSCMSASFDMRTDNRRCIQVFIAFMFASRHDLGFDETVHVVKYQGRSCYGFEVGDRLYRSTCCLFQHNGACLTGRGTRVWEVVRVEDFQSLKQIEEKRCALKDVWLDEDARTEKQILDALFADIDAVAKRIEASDPETLRVLHGFDTKTRDELRRCVGDRRLYSWYFLTIDHDWKGPTSKRRAASAIPTPDTLDAPPSRVVADPRTFPPKYQYRVVFNEVGEALHDVDDISIVLTAAQSCIFALQLLFLAGWVHRDISTGNLIWFNGRGLLADLEYARRFEPDTTDSAGSKTGTPFFMAVEIQQQSLIYQPPVSTYTSFSARVASMESGVVERAAHDSIIHNFEHDLESMFWVLLWTYLARLPHPSVTMLPVEADDDADKDLLTVSTKKSAQKRSAPSPYEVDPVAPRLQGEAFVSPHAPEIIDKLFQNHSGCPPVRRRALTVAGSLSDTIEPVFSGDWDHVTAVFDSLAGELFDSYRMRGHSFHDATTYTGLYKVFNEAIAMLLAHRREHPKLYGRLLVCESRPAAQHDGRRGERTPPARLRRQVCENNSEASSNPIKRARDDDEPNQRSSKMPKLQDESVILSAM